jgi:protease I
MDLKNAGAGWEDAEVIVDAGMVTSRNPGDIPAFNEAMIAVFAGEKAVAEAAG